MVSDVTDVYSLGAFSLGWLPFCVVQCVTGVPSLPVNLRREYYRADQWQEAVAVWEQAEAAFADLDDRLNQPIALSTLALTYQQLEVHCLPWRKLKCRAMPADFPPWRTGYSYYRKYAMSAPPGLPKAKLLNSELLYLQTDSGQQSHQP